MISIHKSRSRPRDRAQSESQKGAAGQTLTLPAPAGGWVETSSALSGEGMWVAENVFPTGRGYRMRGGSYRVANAGAAVASMFSYETSTVRKLFAGTATALYDVSAMDPVNVPAASVSGQTSGYYNAAQLGTVGGEYLYAVNGTDKAQLFDGTAWTQIDGASSPSITGVDTSKFSHVWVHKGRYWFVEKGTTRAWFLPVDSIGGAASDFSLSGVFQEGGSLLFGTVWSQDTGSGMDDRCVFVSDRGEIVVFQGTNPASAADWAQVGLYKMSRPMGPKAMIRAGGDVLFATEDGLFPLSGVISKDPSALRVESVSANIEQSWRREARGWLSTKPWEMVKWPREAMGMVSIPNSDLETYVVNITTGEWAKYTGWDVQCTVLHQDTVFFGSSNGFIYQAERGGMDDGANYVCRWSMAPQMMGAPGAYKSVSAARATFMSAVAFTPQISFSADYAVNFPAAPSAAAEAATTAALWDVGTWDTSKWDDSQDGQYLERPIVVTGWVPQGKAGYVISPQMQITSGSTRRPDAEFLSIDILFETGGVAV